LKKFTILIYVFTFIVIILLYFSVQFGNSVIDVFKNENSVILHYRFYKAIAALLAGCCLPVSGFLLQELFKNPLAGPSVLGISSSAGLGVALVIFLGSNIFIIEEFNQWILVFSALLGSFLCMIILFMISKKMNDKNSFIIIGFLISAFGSAFISFLEYISPSDKIKQYLVWSLGSFSGLSGEKLLIFTLFSFIGLIFALFSVQLLKGNLLGENYAKSLGVNLNKMKIYILLSTSILTGITTAFLGPIAFIGIIIPFFCRKLINPSKLWKQLILNILIGICFMLCINIISNYIMLPINILTSIIGIPVILFIILKK